MTFSKSMGEAKVVPKSCDYEVSVDKISTTKPFLLSLVNAYLQQHFFVFIFVL